MPTEDETKQPEPEVELLEDTAAAALKKRKLTKAKQVDNPGGARARFIGVGPLQGVDTPCRILEVTDSRTGRPVNDAVDVGTIHIVLQPLDADGRDDGAQVKVDAEEGYFIEVVGELPPGVPTGEPQPGARGFEHDPQAGFDVAPADQSGIAPGQGALQALAGAGDHGDPVSDAEKQRRADQAEFQRVLAEEITRTPDDLAGAHARTQKRTGLKIAPAEPNVFPGPDAPPEKTE